VAPKTLESGYLEMVDDNFHYMDEDERYCTGVFPTYEIALGIANSIVIRFFDDADPEASAETLIANYRSFGEDPFIVPFGGAPIPPAPFSAWDFASEVAKRYCEIRGEHLTRQASTRSESPPVTTQTSSFADIEDARPREALEALDAVLPKARTEENNPGTQDTP